MLVVGKYIEEVGKFKCEYNSNTFFIPFLTEGSRILLDENVYLDDDDRLLILVKDITTERTNYLHLGILNYWMSI